MKRHLPLIKRITLYFSTSIQVGLLIFVLGTWLCSSMINVEELLIEHQLHEINTKIEGLTMKRWEADWDDEGRPKLYGYDYYFIHPELGQISNTSFSQKKKGKSTGGDQVQIYYDKNNPYINKIVGMEYAERGTDVLFLLLIPMLGLGFLAYGLHKIRIITYLLNNGIFIWGSFVKHEKTSVVVNGQQQYRLYYRYKTSGGESYIRFFTTTKSSDFDNEEIVLYNKNTPERMILLYELPYIIVKYIENNWEEVKSLQ